MLRFVIDLIFARKRKLDKKKCHILPGKKKEKVRAVVRLFLMRYGSLNGTI